jgi:hypothetical protein
MSDLDKIRTKKDYPEEFIFLEGNTVPKKVAYKLPSRLSMTLDVLIVGTATVRLYASNIEESATGAKWGPHLKEFTESAKLIIEGEPWINWMVEHVSGAGTVDVVLGF